jgi:hypothetical protein
LTAILAAALTFSFSLVAAAPPSEDYFSVFDVSEVLDASFLELRA